MQQSPCSLTLKWPSSPTWGRRRHCSLPHTDLESQWKMQHRVILHCYYKIITCLYIKHILSFSPFLRNDSRILKCFLRKKNINNKSFYMRHSFLINFFHLKSPTQKFHLYIGLENILSIFFPRPIMYYWSSCSIRIYRESQNKTRLTYGFLNFGAANLDSRRQRK